MYETEKVTIKLPPGEIQHWVTNAADNFQMTPAQFLAICIQDAWEKLYAKTFTWQEFTIVERKYLEKLESQANQRD